MDPFSLLPHEILSDIITLLPDLHTLQSLLSASSTASHLFHHIGAEITETIMSRSLPPPIVVQIRMAAMIASSNSLLSTTLDDFTNTYILPVLIASPWCAPLTLMGTQSSVLRRILALHCQIRHLTYCCLHELKRRCLESKPSHLLDQRWGYRKRGPRSLRVPRVIRIPHSLPEGEQYQPQDAGPPSWVEEQRVYRAFWRVQLFLDFRDAVVARGASLGWSSEDVLRVRQSTAASFWEPLHDIMNAQTETVLDYLQDYDLPTTSNSSVGRSLDKLPRTTGNLQIYWPTLEPADTYRWGQSASCLDSYPPGLIFGPRAFLLGPGAPLQYVNFAIFRRLGFAIWDAKRMSAFGFINRPPPPNTLCYSPVDESQFTRANRIFTWWSLLTEEQKLSVSSTGAVQSLSSKSKFGSFALSSLQTVTEVIVFTLSTASVTRNSTWDYSLKNFTSTYATSTASAASWSSAVSNLTSNYTHQAAPSASSIALPTTNVTWVNSTSTVSLTNDTWTYSLENITALRIHSLVTQTILVSEVATTTTATTSDRSIFAHFMVGNVKTWGTSQWTSDIQIAQKAHIDAFALNIAFGEDKNDESIANAFAAAAPLGFKLFFSFDYAGLGPWPEDQVIDLLTTYAGNSAYFQYNGQPFVSTFEGPSNAEDWVTIKAQTGCFLVPAWSSVSAKEANGEAGGIVDGLFNWAAWPWGPSNMNTYVDASYMDFLGDKPYMMPVSPWFYTNMPGYGKNWMWRGDDLWFDRWEEVMFVRPEFVEIITWNDYGESHYIGPIHDEGMEAFEPQYGDAPYNYALGMPHDGWRLFLPFVIDRYKTGTATVTQEGLVSWYRLNVADGSCSDDGTSGNTASQLQIEFKPSEIAQDRIFYSALLTSTADVTVSINGEVLSNAVPWSDVPSGGVGIYHGSVETGGRTGTVIVSLSRSGSSIATVNGASITTDCTDGIANWNAWVGYDEGQTVASTSPAVNLDDEKCIEGSGASNFFDLCEFTCSYGYCPIGACVCSAMGVPPLEPASTGQKGYPIAGLSESFDGLCSYACNLGHCLPAYCGPDDVPLEATTVSPFLPAACVSGTSDNVYVGLCSFACNFGYCPINTCTCTGTGVLIDAPEPTGDSGTPLYGDDSGLCNFACRRGWCPPDVCTAQNSTGSDSGSGVVYIDSSIYSDPDPVVGGYPALTLVFPPTTLPAATTISFPPVGTSLDIGDTVITSIAVPAWTGSVVNFWNLPIASGRSSFSFTLTTSWTAPAFPFVYEGTTVSVTPHPISAGYGNTAAATLPTTVYVSNGVTQTFQEAQFTDLATITAQTTVTTTLVESQSSQTTSSSTTIIPFWVNIGGFYWSPLPLPTIPPIPLLSIPEFPPIPSPPCFKLFDIFTIDCPPIKPTVIGFTRGSPSPTCTANCGTRYTDNCDEECTSTVVTNYWASCSSTDCKTTSSATITGCSVTATSITTTQDSCPTGATALDDDQGDDSPSLTDVVYTIVTIVESVVISGTAYSVTTSGASGVFVIGGTAVQVPLIDSSSEVVQIGGNIVTIFPGSVVPIPVVDTSRYVDLSSVAPSATLNPASCSDSGGVAMPLATAQALVAAFCATENGEEIDNPGPAVVEYNNVDADSNTALFSIGALGTASGIACANFVLSGDTCAAIYDAIVETCSGNLLGEYVYYGGQLSQGCWKYVFSEA